MPPKSAAFRNKAGSFLSNNPLSDRADRRKYLQLQAFRAAIAAILTLFLCQAIDFGVTPLYLILSMAGAGMFAGHILGRQVGFLRVVVWHITAWAAISIALSVANSMLLGIEGSKSFDFLIPRITDNLLLLAVFYGIGFLSTWFFWTRPAAVGLEGFAASGLMVWLLSGHRNYRLDAPKQISSLTWKMEILQQLGAQPQHLILGLGIIFCILLVCYFVLSNNRPIFGRAIAIKSYGKPQKIAAILCPLLVLANFLYYAWYLNANYSANLGRASNGVSPESNLKEGESNLGFNSAVTATRQPAAILRFEGDYQGNPSAPMLYLREGALSSYNGHEFVKGAKGFDSDIPNVGLGQAFASAETDPGPNREPVVQSIYLITKHEAPFAIDVPRRIRPIVNPKPERFRLAYQVLSHAPVKPLEDLVGQPVGDSTWDQATWDHYLRAPGSLSTSIPFEFDEGHQPDAVPDKNGEDLRYRALSKKLTENIDNPIMRVAAIIDYLSKSSVYTRSPGHQVTEGGDPVAPYLFAADKKKGYCVHFAHAAVYLMRAAGIPARIATGYQTDLTYAKDGHVLLMMGDRHAWPEIYVQGYGWTVFDIAPAQAENEPELVPDENLLEQLMSELDAAPEFAPPQPDQNDSDSEQHQGLAQLLRPQTLLLAALTVLALLLLAKFYLWYGFKFARDSKRQTRLAYTSFATRMADIGVYRTVGETRREFVERLQADYSINADKLVTYTERANYAHNPALPGVAELTDSLGDAGAQARKSFSRWVRWISIINPVPLFRIRSL